MSSRLEYRLSQSAGAAFSRCRRYRYALWRNWDDRPGIVFVGLNPSTADARKNDPTIRRIIGFARDWGYGGVVVANLYAWRATRPTDLFAAADPVGPRNDEWLRRLAGGGRPLVACWGNHGDLDDRGRQVATWLGGMYCLGTNAGGAPVHPLYQPADTRPRPWCSG